MKQLQTFSDSLLFIELGFVHKSFNCSEINMISTEKIQVKFRQIPRAN